MATGVIAYDETVNPWLCDFIYKRFSDVFNTYRTNRALMSVTTPELRARLRAALGFRENENALATPCDLLQSWCAAGNKTVQSFLDAMRAAGLTVVLHDTVTVLYDRAAAAAYQQNATPPPAVRREIHVWFTYIHRLRVQSAPVHVDKILWEIQANVVSYLVTYFERALPRCFDGAWRNAGGTLTLGDLRETCDAAPCARDKLPGCGDLALDVIDWIFDAIYDTVERMGYVPDNVIAAGATQVLCRHMAGRLSAIFRGNEGVICVDVNMLRTHAAPTLCLFAQAVCRRRPDYTLRAYFDKSVGDNMRAAIAMVFAVVFRGMHIEKNCIYIQPPDDTKDYARQCLFALMHARGDVHRNAIYSR